ncbi:MAG TPA: hypothetical protein VLD19_20230 [Chitinophagaceae bacterium]|nr:hypothetical protein [Chitinophagaceae bacterium]
MDIHAYIQSGILQDYCLGLLTAEEAARVDEQCALYPEIKTELQACRQALEQYALSHALPVCDTIKDKTLGLIDNLANKKTETRQ